jgi:hypothetical protein
MIIIVILHVSQWNEAGRRLMPSKTSRHDCIVRSIENFLHLGIWFIHLNKHLLSVKNLWFYLKINSEHLLFKEDILTD